MPKHFRITVEGRSYDVVVEELDQITAPTAAPVAASAPVTIAPQAAAPSPAAAPVAAPVAAGAGAIVAPLGGVVFSIDANLGHDVAVGDKVATIEAMKMKTEVRSKIAGKVTSIAANVSESVETGQVLMTLG
jgi:biotin carboxyl carrier protein